MSSGPSYLVQILLSKETDSGLAPARCSSWPTCEMSPPRAGKANEKNYI
jgi:hypothetical protein